MRKLVSRMGAAAANAVAATLIGIVELAEAVRLRRLRKRGRQPNLRVVPGLMFEASPDEREGWPDGWVRIGSTEDGIHGEGIYEDINDEGEE